MNELTEIAVESVSAAPDRQRVELQWTDQGELTIEKWRADSENRSSLHGDRAKTMKSRYRGVGIPVTILPIVVAGVTTYEVVPTAVTQTLLMLCGILTGVGSFMNYGAKYAKHSEFAARYSELSTSIEKEMAKPRAHRVALDAYLESILGSYNRLCSSAPDL